MTGVQTCALPISLDKLEAIPGFHVDLTRKQFKRQLAKLGCAIIGQTADLAPADKRLYALRDVTATIESVPLITGSILSKKLAEGLDGLVMDVKVGRGAFMKDVEHARVLAKSLVRVGRGAGKDVRALLTRMDDPLGKMIGNALEVREAFLTLRGEGPADLLDLTLALGVEMLQLGGVAKGRRGAGQHVAETAGRRGDQALGLDPDEGPEQGQRHPQPPLHARHLGAAARA